MELEELKSRFAALEGKLDAALRLNERALGAPLLARARTAAGRLRRVLVFEVITNAAGLLLVGSFLGDHVGEPRFALPAAALHLGFLAVLAFGVHQLVALSRLEPDGPVVAMQARLEVLRAVRLRATTWTLLVGPLAWTPLLIVSARGLLGIDLWAGPHRGWLLANLLFGAAVAASAALLSRRFAHRWPAGLGRLGRLLAGERVAEAERFVAELDALTRAG